MIKQKATLLIVKYPFLQISWKYFTVLGTIDLPALLLEFGWNILKIWQQ